MAIPRGKAFILAKEVREVEPQSGERGVKIVLIMGVAFS